MKSVKEIEMLYNIELSINELKNYVDEQLEQTRTQKNWEEWYAIEGLLRAMTEIKCSISAQIDIYRK